MLHLTLRTEAATLINHHSLAKVVMSLIHNM